MTVNTDFLPLQVPERVQKNKRYCDSTWMGFRSFQVLILCLTPLAWLTIALTPGQAATVEQDGTPDVTSTSVPQFFTSSEQAAIANALLGLGYLLPVGLGLGIFLYDRYVNYRAALLKQQIQILERIWQQGTGH